VTQTDGLGRDDVCDDTGEGEGISVVEALRFFPFSCVAALDDSYPPSGWSSKTEDVGSVQRAVGGDKLDTKRTGARASRSASYQPVTIATLYVAGSS
jgi:hypothetical protein